MGWGLPRDLTLDILSTIVKIMLIRAFQSTTLDRVDSAKIRINSAILYDLNTKNQQMYKVFFRICRYPHVVIGLVNITTGEKGYWWFSILHEEMLCEEYHVKNLKGVLLDELPQNGGWFDINDINKL